MTFDFIPMALYTPMFYNIMMVVAFITLFQTLTVRIGAPINFTYMKVMGYTVLLFILLYMGLRPIDGVFIDMISYNRMFTQYQSGLYNVNYKDLLFSYFIIGSGKIMDANAFFLFCAFIYVLPLYLVSKKFFKDYWFYSFLMLVCALSFWGYGVNGIRNGMATSLFLFGLSRDMRVFQVLWIILAIGFHKSMMLPALGFFVTQFYNDPRKYLYFWLACIPLSLFLGGSMTSFFASIGFDDERIAYLTTEADPEEFSRTGFRWDFVLYSATAIFSGWYYVFKMKYVDVMYFRLFNIYVFANAFWILVIRANFSNRFAYLSWFMMGLVIIYPLLKQKILAHQHIKIGLILFANVIFTYILAV